MKKRAITFCFAALFLTGCVPSLHRLYDDRTTVSDAKLPGRWIQFSVEATRAVSMYSVTSANLPSRTRINWQYVLL